MLLTRKILIIVLALLLVTNLLFWLMAHASGHRIPPETDLAFLVAATILLLLIFLFKRFFLPKS
jgi:hypothetical protein